MAALQLRKAEGLNKSKKGQQNQHNSETHKYTKQAGRTANNKARNIAKAKKLKAAADARKAARIPVDFAVVD
jgi:hypothetical protein